MREPVAGLRYGSEQVDASDEIRSSQREDTLSAYATESMSSGKRRAVTVNGMRRATTCGIDSERLGFSEPTYRMSMGIVVSCY